MKKYLKGAAGICLLLALISIQSCKKSFLNVNAKGTVASTQFWQSQADATSAVDAMYANLHEWKNIAFAPIAVESMGSEDVNKGSSPTDASYMNDFHNFSANSGEGQIADFWAGQYQTINFANQILDNVPGINMDASLKARYLAEAKFIRAYAYFRLVRAFGDVPLRLHVPKLASEYNIPRTAKAQVWAALRCALMLLSLTSPPSSIFRELLPEPLVGHHNVGAVPLKAP